MAVVGRAAVVGNGALPSANPAGNAPLNKPVIVSEEALGEPVLVPDVTPGLAAKAAAAGPAYVVLAGISFSHFLNDTMQSLIASVYPILKDNYALDFAQIGMITLAFQFTASLLQPVVGHFTDKKAQPFSLAIGMGFTFFGLLLLSVAHALSDHPGRGGAGRPWLGGVPSGVGADRAACLRRPLRLCAIGVPARRQFRHLDGAGAGGADRGAVRPALIAWFSSIAFLAIVILWRIGVWYRPQIATQEDRRRSSAIRMLPDSRRVKIALAVLVALLFSKQLYVSSLSSYYIFYLIDHFGVSTQAAQFYLFIFLAANAAGAFFGGPLGDRFGRKYVIWFSILGALPFTLALPYAGLVGSAVLTVFIGLIISSATSSIIVFAQELMPHRFGMISGVFFGVAFGIGGLGAAVLGKLADHTGIAFVYQLCAFLPAIGLLAVFLPKMPSSLR